MASRIKSGLIAFMLASGLTACGMDIGFFFHFVNTAVTGTTVAIFLHGREDDDSSINGAAIISGTIPQGMELTTEGTIEGTPTEAGYHEFTVEWQYEDGTTHQEAYAIEVKDSGD
jgi:hypothetical protein